MSSDTAIGLLIFIVELLPVLPMIKLPKAVPAN